MTLTGTVILCALACFFQTATSQRLGRGYSSPFGALGRGYSPSSFGLRKTCEYFPPKHVTATSGGNLPVDSASAIPPIGVAVASDNVYEGTLSASGELPFIGTVAIEGVLPTVGTGIVNYKCGNEVSIQATPVPAVCAELGNIAGLGSVAGLGTVAGVTLNGCGPSAVGATSTSGGRLPVKSGSTIPPVGVAVASENVYEGILTATGELPFVGTVGIEGILPTAGTGIVNYSCGSGTSSITAVNSPVINSHTINSPAVAIVTAGDTLNAIPSPIKSVGGLYDVGTPLNTCAASGIAITPTSGGRLPVKSASAIPPVGVSVASETVYEGILSAVGELPFVGTVGAEGVVPTVGIGAVRYGCGNGLSAMTASKFGCGLTGRRFRF